MPNAVVTLQDDAQNLTETIDGTAYAGIRRTYLITPQAAGDYTLPQVDITFTYAAVPGQPPANGSVTLPPTSFTVAGVPGSGSGPGTAVAARVTIEQAVDGGDLENLKVGDAVVRTITITAEGIQAMMIPPPTVDAPSGVRMYRQDPVLKDETTDRGEFVGGRRTDRATYVFEQPGDYTLPAIEIAWFNPATGKSEAARAPEIKVAVSVNPGASPAIAPEPPPIEAAPAPP